MATSFLLGEQVYLRAVEPKDLDVMYDMENDPAMWDISSFTVPYSRHVLLQYINSNQCDIFSDKQIRLMVARRSDNLVVGTIDITDFVPLHRRGAIGIAIHQNYRGQGYAAEALRLLCEYAFDFLNLKQLYAYVACDNLASLGLFSSSGFEQSGLLKEWLLIGHETKDVVLLQRLNPRER
ncbi:MAG: N-acetyltransferase [Bacteroidia bacterium]|nr:N-acetyltransferase [Bacteroidia bacterium]